MSSRDRSNAMFLVLRLFWYVISSIAIGFYRNFVPYSLQKKKNLDGKLILITGAGGGIGYELATKLALSRCRLILWDVVAENNERTAETCRKLGAEVHAYEVDITDRKKVYAIAEKIEFEIGPVDILINNAAVINSYDKGFLAYHVTSKIRAHCNHFFGCWDHWSSRSGRLFNVQICRLWFYGSTGKRIIIPRS